MKRRELSEQLADVLPVHVWRNHRVVVAVSGGADSVALLRALVEMDPAIAQHQLIVAHFNHALRGAESAGDAAFVADLASHWQLEFHLGESSGERQFDEEALRRHRYDFLTNTASKLGARMLVTAHTRDDQIETVLFRILRGTGIEGLAGIAPVRQLTDHLTLIRPMLNVTREQVLEYLTNAKQPFREDHSNKDLRWARNRLRHHILPLLRQQFSWNIDQSLGNLAQSAASHQAFIDRLTETLFAEAVQAAGADRFLIYSRRLEGQQPLLITSLLRRIWREANWPMQQMTQRHWNSAAAALIGDPPASGPVVIELPEFICLSPHDGDWLLQRREC